LAWARWHSNHPLQPWGAPILFAALGLRAWAGMHIGSHSNGAIADAPTWVTSGPYAYARHPLYLANVGVATGLLVFANCFSWETSAIFLAGLGAFYTLLAWHEEARIIQLHPEAGDGFRGWGWASNKAIPPKVEFRDWLARQARNTAYALVLLIGIAVLVALKRILEP
jgi:Isoprenylcysteine carboxyl methyltransferase (ICMT) family